MPHTRKKSHHHRKVKSKRSKKLIHGGSDDIAICVYTRSKEVFKFLNESILNITQTKDKYLEFIQSSRGVFDKKNRIIQDIKEADDKLFDNNGKLIHGKTWEDVQIRFGFPLHESVVLYINNYNTIYFVQNKEVLALCSFAFINNKTGYITDNDITDHIHILSLVNNSNTVKLFTDTILKMFSKLQNVKYVSLSPLISKELDYTHLTKFYNNYQFKYLNDSTCTSSGSCVLFYVYKPNESRVMDEKDYQYTIDKPYYNDILRAIQYIENINYDGIEVTIEKLNILKNLLKTQVQIKKRGEDAPEKAIVWKWNEFEISFRLLSHFYDDRRNVDHGPIEGVEIISVIKKGKENMTYLNKSLLDKFVKSVFHSFKFEKTFITRVESENIYRHITSIGFKPYTECQDEFTSEYCRMVKEIPRTDDSSSSSSNTTRSLQKKTRVFPPSFSSSSNTRTSSMSSISSRSIEPPAFEKLVCKYTPKIGNNPIGSRDSGSRTGRQMGSDKDKDHPIFNIKRDGIDAHYSRFRVMMRLSEYIRDELGFKVLKENDKYIKFTNIDKEESKAYFIIQTDKSKDIPGYDRSLNLIVECDDILVNNQSRQHDHKLIKGTDLINTRIPDFDEFEENPGTEPKIKRISNLSNTVANFFTFKVYCFALSNTIKHKNVVELIPSKREDVNRAVFKFVRDILCKDDGKGELTIRPGNDFNIFSSEVGRVRNQFGDELAQWYETNFTNNEI